MAEYIILNRGHCTARFMDLDKNELIVAKIGFKDGTDLRICDILDKPLKFINSTDTDLFANVFIDIERKGASKSPLSQLLLSDFDKIRTQIVVSKIKGDENTYQIRENSALETNLKNRNEILANDTISSYMLVLKPIQQEQEQFEEEEKHLGQFNSEYILRPNISDENTIEVPKMVNEKTMVVFAISGVIIRNTDNRIVRVADVHFPFYEMEGSQESIEFLNVKHTFQNGSQIDTQFIIDHTDPEKDVFRENIRYRKNHQIKDDQYDFLYGYIVEVSTITI